MKKYILKPSDEFSQRLMYSTVTSEEVIKEYERRNCDKDNPKSPELIKTDVSFVHTY